MQVNYVRSFSRYDELKKFTGMFPYVLHFYRLPYRNKIYTFWKTGEYPIL